MIKIFNITFVIVQKILNF